MRKPSMIVVLLRVARERLHLAGAYLLALPQLALVYIDSRIPGHRWVVLSRSSSGGGSQELQMVLTNSRLAARIVRSVFLAGRARQIQVVGPLRRAAAERILDEDELNLYRTMVLRHG